MCGPHWRSLCEAYGITTGDTLVFEYEKGLHSFNFHVFSHPFVSKPFTNIPECWEIPEICEDALRRTYFSDPADVSQSEMNLIISTIPNHVNKGKDEGSEGPIIYFFHRVDNDEMYKIKLPYEAYDPKYIIPKSGTSMFACGDDIVSGSYKSKPGKHIVFDDGWSEFRYDGRLYYKSLFVAKIDMKTEWINLDVKKIS